MIIIDAPYFYAGAVLDHRALRVIRAAAIIKYMVGWDRHRVIAYAKRRGWSVTVIE